SGRRTFARADRHDVDNHQPHTRPGTKARGACPSEWQGSFGLRPRCGDRILERSGAEGGEDVRADPGSHLGRLATEWHDGSGDRRPAPARTSGGPARTASAEGEAVSQPGGPGVVLDCMVFVQAASRPGGPAARLFIESLEAGSFSLGQPRLGVLPDRRPRRPHANPEDPDRAVERRRKGIEEYNKPERRKPLM